MPAFLSLDGLDGTGKSTQLPLLADWLRAQGRAVTVCTDPGGTEIGAKLREILLFGRGQGIDLRTEALLFMASRAELVARVIRPALERGEIVLSDRYLLANVVYQGHAGGLDPAELWSVGAFSTGGVMPDLTLLLDLPPDAAKHRRGRPADAIEARGAGYFERVRAGFLREAERLGPERVRVIDASPGSAEVHAAICGVVGGWLG